MNSGRWHRLAMVLFAVAVCGSVGSAQATCGGGAGRLDYELPDRWLELETYKRFKLADFCAAHDACYRELGADRKSCDEALAEELDELCDRHFEEKSLPYGNCHKLMNQAQERVRQRGPARFRALQRAARQKDQMEKRKEARDNRREARAAKRAKRRREAYRDEYNEQFGLTPATRP